MVFQQLDDTLHTSNCTKIRFGAVKMVSNQISRKITGWRKPCLLCDSIVREYVQYFLSFRRTPRLINCVVFVANVELQDISKDYP